MTHAWTQHSQKPTHTQDNKNRLKRMITKGIDTLIKKKRGHRKIKK